MSARGTGSGRHWAARSIARGAVLVAAWTAPLTGVAGAEEAPAPPRIHSGAIEIGIAGALDAVEGNSGGDVALRGGSFVTAGHGLAGGEIEAAYAHVAGLDRLDLECALSWQPQIARAAVLPFAALGGGVRQEWLGSFRQARYPIGLDAGARVLIGERAGVRVEYRFRRVLHDPVADFSEHRLLVGLSLFFRNSRRDSGAVSPR